MLFTLLGTVEGPSIHIEYISIDPCNYAFINYKLISKNGTEILTHKIEGEQYKQWKDDDTILFHLLCAKHKLHYKPYEEPEFFEECMVSKDEKTGEMKYDMIKTPNPKYNPNKEEYKPVEIPPSSIVYEDSRSVHNEADIQRIQTLQEQLDAQASKLKTITDMLIGKGLV
jgi:hypothetical protein